MDWTDGIERDSDEKRKEMKFEKVRMISRKKSLQCRSLLGSI